MPNSRYIDLRPFAPFSWSEIIIPEFEALGATVIETGFANSIHSSSSHSYPRVSARARSHIGVIMVNRSLAVLVREESLMTIRLSKAFSRTAADALARCAGRDVYPWTNGRAGKTYWAATTSWGVGALLMQFRGIFGTVVEPRHWKSTDACRAVQLGFGEPIARKDRHNIQILESVTQEPHSPEHHD